MSHFLERTEVLIGKEGLVKLAAAKVAVFGLGGVGSYAVEALARSGVGYLCLIDHDRVKESNINRQLLATRETLGALKTEVMARRIGTINPGAVVDSFPEFYAAIEGRRLLRSDLDFIVDAIDTVSAKVDLILAAREMKIPIISSMGAGNRLNPSLFRVADIADTHTCPLARVMRRELRRRGVTGGVKVVFSTEVPRRVRQTGNPAGTEAEGPPAIRPVPGSISFVPPVAGMILAGVVIRTLLGEEGTT